MNHAMRSSGPTPTHLRGVARGRAQATPKASGRFQPYLTCLGLLARSTSRHTVCRDYTLMLWRAESCHDWTVCEVCDLLFRIGAAVAFSLNNRKELVADMVRSKVVGCPA